MKEHIVCLSCGLVSEESIKEFEENNNFGNERKGNTLFIQYCGNCSRV